MTARIELPPLEALTGEIGTLAQNWKAMGSDTAFLRMLNYRADLVPEFFDFYIRLRGDGLLPAKLKERDIARWRALAKEAGIRAQ